MIKKFFRKARLKGMTLVEVIVALAVFTIMTSAMALCAGSVSKIVTENIFFNRKMNEQRVIVDNMQDVGDENVADVKMQITLQSTSYTLNTAKNTAEENHCNNGLNFKYLKPRD
ncbi:MAG: prepilin-type N-terminal cleavage/methylation domain-containing protein [Oscillospiraceae bacterium]|nr:prepilin-type N-terminal cleavage/methylation domain-containing protein [Oscillospiraceae bacterium]